MKRVTLLSLAMAFSLSANANLIIDKSGVDEKDYVYDMHQCEEMSNQVQKDTRSRGAVGGALKGAAIGSAGVAIAGGSGSEGAKKGAAVGLGAGVIGGSRDRRENQANYEQDQQTVMRNCMTNRGYVVLN
ncbi:glycine zipper family protein [Vibrio kyushuensis]|uniref:glycine zipper family protein n=1 Tax=Vibrio kyushuensis TaxID=2910249 RepID=UPI003D105D1C